MSSALGFYSCLRTFISLRQEHLGHLFFSTRATICLSSCKQEHTASKGVSKLSRSGIFGGINGLFVNFMAIHLAVELAPRLYQKQVSA